MTWLDVTDDAIKIGLGVFLGGLFSLLVLRLSHRHELRKENLRRRQEIMERVVEHLEAVDEEVSNVVAQMKVCLAAPSRSDAREEGRKQVLRLLEGLDRNLTALNGDEGKLLLIGLVGSAKRLADYRLAARDSFTFVEQYDEQGFDDRLNGLIDRLAGLRADFFKQAEPEYRGEKPSLIS